MMHGEHGDIRGRDEPPHARLPRVSPAAERQHLRRDRAGRALQVPVRDPARPSTGLLLVPPAPARPDQRAGHRRDERRDHRQGRGRQREGVAEHRDARSRAQPDRARSQRTRPARHVPAGSAGTVRPRAGRLPAGTLPCTQLGTQWFLNGAINPRSPSSPVSCSAGGSSTPPRLVPQAPARGPAVPGLATDGNYLRRSPTGHAADRPLLPPRDPRPGRARGRDLRAQPPLSDTGCSRATAEATLATLNSSGPRSTPRLPPRASPTSSATCRRQGRHPPRDRLQPGSRPSSSSTASSSRAPQDVMERMELNKTAQWTITQHHRLLAHLPHPHQRLPDDRAERQAGRPASSSTTTSRSRPARASRCANGRRTSPASSSSTATSSATRTTG